MAAFGVISILVGVFALVITIAGGRDNATLWGVAAVFLVGGGFLIWAEVQANRRRRAAIMAHAGEWGAQIIEAILARRLAIDMNTDMVQLSWGRPNYVDEKEVTSKSTKERWVYGQPRRGARYVWFANGKVTKIKS